MVANVRITTKENNSQYTPKRNYVILFFSFIALSHSSKTEIKEIVFFFFEHFQSKIMRFSVF